MSAAPVYSRSGSCPKGHERINIRYFVVKNTNRTRGGFSPMIAVNGRLRSSGSFSRGYDRDEALRLAKGRAHEEADHYRGDWCITIGKGRPGKLKTRRKR